MCVFDSEKKKSLCVIKDCKSVRACMVQMGLLHFSSSVSLFFSFQTPQTAQDKCVFVCIEAWFIYSSVQAQGVSSFLQRCFYVDTYYQTMTNQLCVVQSLELLLYKFYSYS